MTYYQPRDLNAYFNTCLKEVEAIGIRPGNIVEVKVNTRARHRWGQCKCVPGGYSININAALLNPSNDERGLKETLIHEILHTVPGSMDHGIVWKSHAEEMNRHYGYNIKRCSSSEEKGVTEDYGSRPKYTITCQRCGRTFGRDRASNLIKHTSLYYCARCKGPLKVRINY